VSCDTYREAGCGPAGPDTSYCVRIEDAPGALYPSGGGSGGDYDALGNGCPATFSFDVLETSMGGVGNRVYLDQDGNPPVVTDYEQIANSVTGTGTAEYRTVLDGVSYDHLSMRVPGVECAGDSAGIAAAAGQEINAALNWIFDGNLPGLCAEDVTSAPGEPRGLPAPVNALFDSRPNPVERVAVIRFSLARQGDAELAIYDVCGRRVRTLVNGPQPAGMHEVLWNGTDDGGVAVARGVYWSRLRAGDYRSSRKMILME
jgi:hypothetical protein